MKPVSYTSQNGRYRKHRNTKHVRYGTKHVSYTSQFGRYKSVRCTNVWYTYKTEVFRILAEGDSRYRGVCLFLAIWYKRPPLYLNQHICMQCKLNKKLTFMNGTLTSLTPALN